MGAAKAPKGTKKPALTPGIMRNHVQFASGAWVPHLKKISIAITLGMLRRPLKTLRRATGPIVSSMGAAKAPKGTKKPAQTPGIMRNHVQFASGAWVPHLKKISKTILLSPLVCLGDT